MRTLIRRTSRREKPTFTFIPKALRKGRRAKLTDCQEWGNFDLCGECVACKQRERDQDAWQREMAMEAGMGLGADAYNDMMGFGGGGPPDCPRCLRPRVAGHHGCMCEDD